MKIFVLVVAAVFAIGVVAEDDKNRRNTLAVCFCVSIAALTVIYIL